jgi:ABC-2 type transport system ATP-binding protein
MAGMEAGEEPMAPILSSIVLRATDLTKRYGDLLAVDRLSLEVHRGEILGFLGPNGAGKTTTLRMLCGLLRPDAGLIDINGRRIGAGDTRGLRTIGVSPQTIAIWDMLTCLEQLEFMGRMYGLPRAAARRRADELLTAFGLEEKRHRCGRTLSGGMQRRLNTALGFVHDPEIVFLDEPQAGLDPQSRVLVREYIRSLAGKVTAVVTTHDMEEAEKISDRVCIIDHGRVLALDTVEGIKARLGEEDLFEIEVNQEPERAFSPIIHRLRLEGRPPVTEGNTMRFTADVKRHGLTIERLGMRKKTLEDVFIRLTGRGLRE